MQPDFPWGVFLRARYVLVAKPWPGGWRARARGFWHHVVRAYRYEVCGHCGRPVGVVWWCPDAALWLRVNGSVGGIMCIPCFAAGAEAIGEFVRFEVKPL